MRCTTVALALLALLAACELAAPAAARRSLAKSQSQREAEQLAAQVKEQEQLVAGQSEREQALLQEQVKAQERQNKGSSSSSSDSGSSKKKSGSSSSDSGSSKSSSSSDSGSSKSSSSSVDCSGLSKKACKKAKRAAKESSGGSSARVSAAAVDTKGGRSGGGASGVPATYHDYQGAGYGSSVLFCADAFGGNVPAPGDWTAYCVGDMQQSDCGRCLRITNLDTGASTTATAVDKCGTGGVDLERKVFDRIDTNGNG